MRKIKMFILLFVGLLTLCIFASCNTPSESPKTESDVKYMTLRINPEVGFFLNENEEVTDVVALNDDADVLLVDLELVGLKASEVAEVIVNECIEAGYIDVEATDTTVNVSIEGKVVEEVSELTEQVKEKVNEFFASKGIFGNAVNDDLDTYQELANDNEISKGKAKLIMLAIKLNPELTVEELKVMETEEIIELCHKDVKENNFGHTLNEEFKEKFNALKEEHSKKFDLEDEIKKLEEEMKKHELTDEEKQKIEEELKAKEEEFKMYEEAFKTEMDKIREELKNKKEESKENLEAEKQERIDQIKEKLEDFKQKLEEGMGKVYNDVEAFQVEVKALNTEYAHLEALKNEITELSLKLFSATLEERTEIMNSLKEKQETLTKDLTEYNKKLKEIHEKYKMEK